MPDIQNAMALCKAHNKFLFEARPDIFPAGFLSETEMALWARYYEQNNDRRKK